MLARPERTWPRPSSPSLRLRPGALGQLAPAVLMGMPVYDLAPTLPPAGIPKPPLTVAVGIPGDLIRRRPDIRQAEQRVAAQGCADRHCRGRRYPQFGEISGFIGDAANDLQHLFGPQNFTGFVLPNLSWNILNYGRIANNVRVQDARFQRTVLEYQQVAAQRGEVEDRADRLCHREATDRVSTAKRDRGGKIGRARCCCNTKGAWSISIACSRCRNRPSGSRTNWPQAEGDIAVQLIAGLQSLGRRLAILCRWTAAAGSGSSAARPPPAAEPVPPGKPAEDEVVPVPPPAEDE